MPPPPPRWQAVFYPFTGLTWSALGVTLLATTLFFHLLIFRNHSPVYNYRSDVVSTLVWLIRVLLYQAVPRVPSSPGTRPFLVCWWLVMLVLSASYVTNIVAYITVPGQPSKIKTLEKLAASDHPLYMGDYGSFVPGYLATSTDPVYQQLSDKLTLIQDYVAVKDHVIANWGGFIEGTGYMEYEITQWPVRDMYYVEETLYPYTVAWAFQKGTPWLPVFNKYLSSMIESGLVERWKTETVLSFHWSKGYVAKRSGGLSTSHTLRPLSLEDLQSSFYVLGIGVMLAAMVLFVEFVHVFLSKRRT